MIEDTGVGWGTFSLGGFSARFSYISDVPFDLLGASLRYLRTGETQVVELDREGSTYLLILTPVTTYVIDERDEPTLYAVDRDADDVIAELVADVESHTPRAWAEWLDDEYADELAEELERLLLDVKASLSGRRG